VDLELLCKAVGVDRVSIVDPFDLKAMEDTLRRELDSDEPSVIIAQRPCALLKSVKYSGTYAIGPNCKKCGKCMKIGCPAISRTDGVLSINPDQCVGCGMCVDVCPFGIIKKEAQ
jgi:indolepyruvate ferredoxin oxidoreductase alpha subunit